MTAGVHDRSGLEGKRILLVEDNFLIASHLKSVLLEWGCDVVGPAPSLDEAKHLARTAAIDGAILDINIVGGSSFAVAQELERRRCPFIFITGYGSPHGMPASMVEVKRLLKPIDERALELLLRDEFSLN